MVDTIAALATCDFRMDEWRIDVAVCGSQKGLMLPPGIGFLGVSEKAFHASQSAGLPRDYWDWRKRSPDGKSFRFCGTAPEQLVFGMREAIDMLFEEGLDNVFARHKRLSEAVRRAVTAWGEAGAIEVYALDPRLQANSITTVLLSAGHAPAPVRKTCHERLNVSLGAGLLHLRESCFRIGHLGDLNEPMVLGALGAIEVALEINGVPHGKSGVRAAVDYLAAA